MRKTFIKTLTELARKDERIVFLTADLGFSVVEEFQSSFPDRFFNVGVSEQNMLGMATGLANRGFIPFVYSIGPFTTLRPYEFIKNGPVLHHLPVRIVAIGGGFEYGNLGPTHHLLEDIALMRVYKNLHIIAPADYQQARSAIESTYHIEAPIYYRIGKDDTTTITGLNGDFHLGKAQVTQEGKDIIVFSLGSIAHEAEKAGEYLHKEHGISIQTVVISSITPFPYEELHHMLRRFSHAITIEAHYENGGIGSAIAEIIAENSIGCRLTRLAVKSPPPSISGSQSFMHKHCHIAAEDIIETVKKIRI